MEPRKGKQLKGRISLPKSDNDDSESSHMEPRYEESSVEYSEHAKTPKKSVIKRRKSTVTRTRQASVLYSPMRKQAKADRLSSFQKWDCSWKSTPFLQANDYNSKEGRKLKLDNKKYRESFQKAFSISSKMLNFCYLKSFVLVFTY